MSTTPNPQVPGSQPVAPASSSNTGCKIILWILGILAFLGIVAVIVIALLFHYAAHKLKQTGDLMTKNPIYATAKLEAQFNPDMEIVSSDDSNGSLVVRNKKTGKVVTMKVDTTHNTMTVTDENGKTSIMKYDPEKKTLVVSDDKGATSSLKVSGDGSTGTVEMQGADGSTLKMGTSADSAPSWVPVYPGVTPKNTMSASNKDGQSGTFTFTTSDSGDKVIGYYSDSLKSGGFKASTTTTNQDGKVGGYVTGTDDTNKKTVTVIVGADDKGTEVSVTYNSKP